MAGLELPNHLVLRILLVEDDELMREAVRAILVRARQQVVTAQTVGEAMARLAQAEFDLILSDVLLPDGSGFAVAAEGERTQPGRPVLLMSAFAATDLVLTGSTANLRGFLRKPFTPRELLEAIAAAAPESRRGEGSPAIE